MPVEKSAANNMINHIEKEKQIAKFVAKVTGIRYVAMQSRDRSVHIVRGRAIYSAIMRAHGFSYPAIGEFLNRDHTTIMALVKNCERHGYLAQMRLALELEFPEVFLGANKMGTVRWA